MDTGVQFLRTISLHLFGQLLLPVAVLILTVLKYSGQHHSIPPCMNIYSKHSMCTIVLRGSLFSTRQSFRHLSRYCITIRLNILLASI